MNNKKIEIMSPAGSFDALNAAIKAGADSVYFGIEQMNMRARAANNFKTEDLPEIMRMCNEAGVRAYLTLNTILYDLDLELMKKICDNAKKVGVTAVIACDISVLQYAKSIGLEVHISTQQNVSNIESVKFFSQFADVVVLARELTLKQIKNIVEQIKTQNVCGPNGELIQIELFAHGALCVAISGKCHMSLTSYNAPANRGVCLQNCRRSYKVIDEETGVELSVDNKYIMSPKDLCTIGFLDKILDTGVYVLKLEGRGRSADYVSTVTKTYREAVDSVHQGTYTKEKIEKWVQELATVFNRGFWHGGYYLGKKLGEWSGVYGSRSSKVKTYIGVGKKFYKKISVGEFLIETGELCEGDEVVITGPTTGALKIKIKDLRVDGVPSKTSSKGDLITFPVPERIRKNDKLFVNKERE